VTTDTDLDHRLKSTLSDVLGIAAGDITDATSPDNVATWDSLAHMNLIIAVEEAFDVTIPDDEAVELTSYPLLRLTVAEQLATRR
jgi:acyl carrier protein